MGDQSKAVCQQSTHDLLGAVHHVPICDGFRLLI
jgi:hypothetical protein